MSRVIGVLLVLLLGLTGTAEASGGGDQHFVAAGRVEAPSITIIGRGVINGVGPMTAEAVDFHQADNTYRETDLAAFGAGSLTLSVNGRFSVWPFTLDPLTCTRHGTLGGTWRISAGSGAFAHAGGGGTFSGRFLTYSSKGPSGCDENAVKGVVSGELVGNVRL